ncbi:MAG: alpha/beta fold hydrolase [Bacteroidales bacterium]
MGKSITYRGQEIRYEDQGNGACIVLLHGYLETGEIWKDFAERLGRNFRVIVPDLPGHGQSGTWGKVHTMEELAGAVKAVLEEERIEKILLVGHSMGGYVTMAFADLHPEALYGYVLFHSTCFADSEDKKRNRQREISLVLCGKKCQIVNVNIPKGFANENVERLKDQVEKARNIALENPDEGIVAMLNGMIQRPDRTRVLQDSSLPLLLIGGMEDNYIPVEVFEKLVSLAPHARVLRLSGSGHMGFIEEPEQAADAISGMLADNSA